MIGFIIGLILIGLVAGAVARLPSAGTAQNDGRSSIAVRRPKSKVPDGMPFAILPHRSFTLANKEHRHEE